MLISRFTRVLGISLAVAAPLASMACGSDDDGEGLSTPGGVTGTTGSGTGGTISGVSGGSGGTTGNQTPNQDGGSVDLTDEEADAIADAACAGWAAEGENLPAALQLVVDVSGSMDDPAPSSGGGNNQQRPSKWSVTQSALEDAIAALPASVSLGVLYYPNRQTQNTNTAVDVSECVAIDEMVPMGVLGGPGDPHREDVMQSLEDADTGSLTPTHDAYKYALENSLIPYQTTAKKFMLLITDGAPTKRLGCIGSTNPVQDQPTDPIIQEIAGAYAQGIATFLIGSPGSEESSESQTDMRPWLSRAAQEGGTAASGCQTDGPNFCHMDMTQEPDFAQALTDGLRSVVGQIVDSCTFVLPTPPPGEELDPALTNLVINWGSGSSSLILPDGIGNCTEGWRFNDNQEVVLCSETCDAIKADAGATVQLTFGCTTGEVIPVR